MFIETKRLILREILPTDVDGIFELDSDPEVCKYLGKKPILNKEQAFETIESIIGQYVENGTGRLAIIDKDTSEFIGWAGIKLEKSLINNNQNYYDLGYRILKKFWGKGIATESAIASMEYAFENLKIKKINACANIDNVASNKILKKIGFNLVETFDLKDYKCNWYEIVNK